MQTIKRWLCLRFVVVEMVLQCGIFDFVSFPLPISIPPLIRTILSPCNSPDQAVFVGDRPFAGETVLTSHSNLETGQTSSKFRRKYLKSLIYSYGVNIQTFRLSTYTGRTFIAGMPAVERMVSPLRDDPYPRQLCCAVPSEIHL